MRYSVRHRTTFVYEQPVSVSHHVLHLTPRNSDSQQLLSSTIDVDPRPTMISEGTDYFGNAVQYLTVSELHERLTIEARSMVRISDGGDQTVPPSPPWEDVRRTLRASERPALEAYEFVFDSPYAAATPEIAAFARESFRPARPVLEAALDLTRRIYTEFEYRGGVSDVSTPVADVLSMRQGVCQDFAHLQIACVRSLRIPARYVSGYLLTRPPTGRQKLVGADASHAWLSVWSGTGWVDFDPTNNLVPGMEHVTVGWGRDYGDVSPINGFVVGGGQHEVQVGVDVDPV